MVIIEKAMRKLRTHLVTVTKNSPFYLYIYQSYWHYLFYSPKEGYNPTVELYYTARPNPGAGIGHQMANWIAGYWYAKQFELKFAHLPFSSKQWEDFLGFGINETTVKELKQRKYKVRKLPLFNAGNEKEIAINKKIIQSYSGEKVVFIAEQDQFYEEQHGVMKDIKRKFYSAPARKNDKLIYSKENFNIAIHVRRGDIMADPSNPNLAMRYLSNDYYKKALQQVIDSIKIDKPIHIYIFSQGIPQDYPEFAHYKNIHWCLDMSAQDSFLHMVYADLLITSKSSFSYKPALLSNGIKVCPKYFWHGYPDTEDWILCDNNGNLDNSLKKTSEINSKKMIHE